MKRIMNRPVISLTTLMLIVFLSAADSFASQTPYYGYSYDYQGVAVPASVGHVPEKVIYGEDIGIGSLKSPQDLCVYDDELYVLDAGNARIVVLDKNLEVTKVISSYVYDNAAVDLKNPSGIFIKDDQLFICDTDGGNVYISDLDGNIVQKLNKPESDLIPAGTEYKPSKCVVDRAGNVYVLSAGVFQGLVNYDRNGQFTGFFGSNKVQMSLGVLTAQFWKRIFTRSQKENTVRLLPVEYSNLFISGDFIYTCTKAGTNSLDEVQKLNPLGINILHYSSNDTAYPKNNFGDVESAYYRQVKIDSAIIDVHVDDDGIISLLDQERGRIFLYDQECNLLDVFGSKGSQKGTFRMPAAIEKFNGQYVVLDSQKNNITFFSETEYMKTMREGIYYYSQGLYKESIEPFTKILELNSRCSIAYRSIGRSLIQEDRYIEAMEYFRLSQNREDYSRAYREQRKRFVRDNFVYLILGAAVITYLLIRVLNWILKKLGVKVHKTKITVS